MRIHHLAPSITSIEPASMPDFPACGGVFIESPRREGIDSNFGPETASWLRARQPEQLIAVHYPIDHIATLKHGQMEGIDKALNTIVRREEQIIHWTAEGLGDAEFIARSLVYPGHAKYKTEFRYLMGYGEEKPLAQDRSALVGGGVLAAKNREEVCI